MADQTVKKGVGPQSQDVSSTPSQPALDKTGMSQSGGAVNAVFDRLKGVVARTNEYDIREGLEPLSMPGRVYDREAGLNTNSSRIAQAFLIDQRPTPVRYTPENGAALQTGTLSYEAPILDGALGYIRERMREKGLNPLASATVAQNAITDLTMVPPLSPEAEANLRATAILASNRITEALASRGIDVSNAAVPANVARQGLVYERVETPRVRAA